jgi:fumarylacetoacetase
MRKPTADERLTMTVDARLDETHDPDARSWVDTANGHAMFPVQNLPLGCFSLSGERQLRAGIAIGDQVLDLCRIEGLFEGATKHAVEVARGGRLNALLAMGAEPRRALRRAVFELLTNASWERAVIGALVPATECEMHLPATIGDYTDFYAGIHHAENIGRQFRPDNPLLPNYKHVPIGYHGRSSSIVVSGTPVVRPSAQVKGPDDAMPSYRPTRRLDYELELGVWIGGANPLGEPIAIDCAGDYVAGLCLLNDWSARDVQVWEYQPLGPFLAKNFTTSISPWIVTTEALAPYRIPQAPRPAEDPQPLPYLLDPLDQARGSYAITMDVHLLTSSMREKGIAPHRLSSGPMSVMYWTVAQLIAHHTCNGCNLQPGDLLGTGTLSGTHPSTFGSLMELSQGGKAPIQLPNGEQRTFLEDGDEVIFTAFADAPGRARIGFGECRGRVS